VIRCILIIAATTTIAGSARAQAPALAAQPSTRGTAVVTLAPPQGVTDVPSQTITVDYGQPHLRGRRLHTGDLVPLDSVWRLGANNATTIETGVDLTIGGRRLAKGKYTLRALPTAAGWTLIVNSDLGNDYVPAKDIFRVPLRKRSLSAPLESFSLWLIPSREAGAPSGELRFAWGDVELSTDWRVP
jgi:hypothetical protein